MSSDLPNDTNPGVDLTVEPPRGFPRVINFTYMGNGYRAERCVAPFPTTYKASFFPLNRTIRVAPAYSSYCSCAPSPYSRFQTACGAAASHWPCCSIGHKICNIRLELKLKKPGSDTYEWCAIDPEDWAELAPRSLAGMVAVYDVTEPHVEPSEQAMKQRRKSLLLNTIWRSGPFMHPRLKADVAVNASAVGGVQVEPDRSEAQASPPVVLPLPNCPDASAS